MNFSAVVRYAMSGAALTWAGAVAAQEDMPDGCEMTTGSEIIRLVHCASPLLDSGYAEAGRAACGAQLPCGAWIWADRSDMPDVAPENHDGLTQTQVASSIGVWVAEQQNLVRIEKVN